ncbi:MAG: hypothetical protein ABI637_00550 [Gemmatimonadota bacterium]
MKISQQQADALGGCVECQPATTPAVASERAPIAAVVLADPVKPDWIGIELIDRSGAPLRGEPYLVTLADGHQIGGKLDNLGRVRIEGVDPGSCTVTFPERDRREWKPR